MGKKTKSKQRLDTYYHFAKMQGYRSRAAYKLVQLNRKYNFLNNSTILIDLCAAPGGWMQVASECMPLNSTIVGVDLDPIKKVPGTKSFQGDITTSSCYEQLRKEIKGAKCDVVLNDGAPNVGANWSKDAYTQSELVLAALKLACSFLREGGFFVTKVFRSTDFQSLMWVFRKFFERVQATKPKASRFSSAEIFVVCAGYSAPSFIDEKLFDAKYVFKDTEGDHFHDQLAGDITSIDRLLETRRNRGGYDDNAPQHLYKETSLTKLMQAENPLLIFAEFNKITTTKEERDKYYGKVKNQPADLDEMFDDVKVLGKGAIASILKWRGKVHHYFNQIKSKERKEQQKNVPKLNVDEQQDSQAELEKEVLQERRREIKQLKEKEEKRGELMIKSQMANHQKQEGDDELGEEGNDMFGSDIEDIQYDPEPEEQQFDGSEQKKKFRLYSSKQMQKHLEQMYEAKKQAKEEKQQNIRDAKQARKDRRQQRAIHKESKLKSRKIGADPALVKQSEEPQEEVEQPEPFAADDGEVKFRNPLADMSDDDLYISENEESYHENIEIDPNEKMDGEVSDDEPYVIPKATTDMQKRRKMLKKTREKKQKQLKKDIVDGQDVGGQIEIVKRKQMEDYNIDELAQTLAIAKKMLRNRSRDQIIDNSYNRYSFEDHDELPKWFVEDEQKHSFKQEPITKEQFQREKERIMAINARVPAKVMEARVRKKMRVQKKLRKTQKQAESLMSQEGISEYNKLKQVSKLYDKSKSNLKDNKKYLVSKKGKTGAGKDSRNMKHVDSRMKKDKRSMKVKKSRHVNRKHKRRGKF